MDQPLNTIELPVEILAGEPVPTRQEAGLRIATTILASADLVRFIAGDLEDPGAIAAGVSAEVGRQLDALEAVVGKFASDADGLPESVPEAE
ncbi:MAG: hypothetical protein ACFB0C_15580 [Leptolyngbyaceae cyanobacterium]